MVATPQPSAAASSAAPARRASAISLARLRWRHLELPLLSLAAALLIVSIALPYWHLTLHAPQYPQGLTIDVYVYKMEPLRNVREVDNLNHYIGMIPLTDAATIERKISRFAIPVLAAMAIASFWLRGRWRTLARVPMVIYPVVFVADLFAWLYYAGHSLDPHAPLSSSIKEFTPRLYGTGIIGQFSTKASFEPGFWLAVAAAVIVLVVMLLGRRSRDAAR
ncbi:MAG TPA: cytochrome C [Thermomicrobiales bacterium]